MAPQQAVSKSDFFFFFKFKCYFIVQSPNRGLLKESLGVLAL